MQRSDCVQIRDESDYNGVTGRIVKLFMSENKKRCAQIRLDGGKLIERPISALIERSVMACEDEFSVETEKEAVEEAVRDEKKREAGFGICARCHKRDVLPSAWIPLCPSCEFLFNLDEHLDGGLG